MDEGEWTPEEAANVGARHFVLSRNISRNSGDPDAPYTLHGLLYGITPTHGYPFTTGSLLFAYAEWFGDPGEYDVWIDLFRVTIEPEGEVTEEVEVANFGPFGLELVAGQFVQGRAYALKRLPFAEPGLYELRLSVGGLSQPVASVRLYLKE